jgi:hypothetical protein
MGAKVMRILNDSLIGVTAHWTCCVCGAKATTHQLVTVADPSLDLPKGWTQRKGRTYCETLYIESAALILKERTQ